MGRALYSRPDSNSALGVIGGGHASGDNQTCPAGAEAGGPVEPPGSVAPFGNYDAAESPEAGRVRVAGWAIDNDARTSPVGIHVYIGGQAGTAGAEGHDLGVADGSRPGAHIREPR